MFLTLESFEWHDAKIRAMYFPADEPSPDVPTFVMLLDVFWMGHNWLKIPIRVEVRFYNGTHIINADGDAMCPLEVERVEVNREHEGRFTDIWKPLMQEYIWTLQTGTITVFASHVEVVRVHDRWDSRKT